MYVAVGLLLAGVVLLLATPIDVRLFLERDEAFRSRARIRWLFGLVRFRIHSRHERARPAPKEAPAPPRRKRRGARAARRVATALMRPDLRPRALGFLRDLLRALRLRDVRVRARIGLDDPADTGRLWAVLGPLGALLRFPNVELEPDFFEACFRFQAAARVRLIPLQLFALTAGFVVSPPVLRALLAR